VATKDSRLSFHEFDETLQRGDNVSVISGSHAHRLYIASNSRL